MTRRVAAAMPAFQVEAFVADVVRRTLAVLPDLLVIDDGSSDHTGDVARSAGAEVVTMPHNLGKGAALRVAFREIFRRGYEAVVTLDADGQHLPEEIPKLLRGWDEGGDLVLGTRDHLYSQMGRLRRTSNRASSRAISIVAGTRLKDVQTGFRLYTRALIAATGFPNRDSRPRPRLSFVPFVEASRSSLSQSTWVTPTASRRATTGRSLTAFGLQALSRGPGSSASCRPASPGGRRRPVRRTPSADPPCRCRLGVMRYRT